MNAIDLKQAQVDLPKLIGLLRPGEEVEIIENQQVVAKLVGQKRQRQFGLGKQKLVILQEDDEHLEEFKEYLP